MTGETIGQYGAGLVLLAGLYLLLDKTFKKIISNLHTVQENQDKLNWRLNEVAAELAAQVARIPTTPGPITSIPVVQAPPPPVVPPPSNNGAPHDDALGWLARHWGANRDSTPMTTREDSLANARSRNHALFQLDDLMPLEGHDDEIVLVYGCGDGGEVVGMIEASAPKRVIVVDDSAERLAAARQRLALHGRQQVEFTLLSEGLTRLPIADASVDYVHCESALHGGARLSDLLNEFARVLRKDGKTRIRLRNPSSVWKTVGTSLRKKAGLAIALDDATPTLDQKAIARLAGSSGLAARKIGNAVSMLEMQIVNRRIDLLLSNGLSDSARDWLARLQLDAYGRPMVDGEAVGIFDVYELVHA